jgi:hypothetical protein
MVGNASATVTGPSTVVNFPVTRSGDLSYDAYLSFQTQDGSAAAGKDYSPLQGSWLLPAGVANLTIPVIVNGSNAAAADKAFALNMLGISTTPPNFALASQQDFPAGSNPYAVFAADVNGDGKPDLIVADYAAGTVTVLLNTTAPGALTPSFAAGQTFSVGSTTFAVVVADMNGDGKPDVITSDLNDGTLSVLLNTTTPGSMTASFAGAQTFTVQAGSAASIAVADLNGDGKPDLVVGSNSNAVTVFINNTATDSATVQLLPQSVAIGGNASSTYVALADLDGDGKPDLVVTDSSLNTVSALLNTTVVGSQTASFGAPLVINTGTGPLMCAVADVNGDGKPDLIVANETGNSLSVFLNLTTPGTGTPNFSSAQTFAVAGSPRSVAAADVDGDGRSDLIVGYDATTTTGVSVLINKAEPGAPAASFAAPQVFGTTFSSYLVATADVNGDGLQDVIAKDGDNIIVFLNTTTPGGASPTADLSVTSLAFGNQSVGTTSASQSVTLTNHGDLVLKVANVSITTPFALQTDTCSNTNVAPGANCTLTVIFTPTTFGAQAGSITIPDNAAGSPQVVSLSGTGLQAIAGLSQTNLTFGNQDVSSTSTAQTVTLTNSGNEALNVSFTPSGPFAETDNCDGSVAAGSSCTISVTFTPTTFGAQTGSIALTDNATGGSQTISLSGTGLGAGASLSPASLTFGNQNVGATGTAQTVTLTNSGNLPLNLSNIAVSGSFALQATTTCSTSAPVAANGTCVLSVTFTATASGTQTGSITLTDDATGGSQTVSLSGIGLGAGASLSPASLTFADQNVGSTSTAQLVTLTNSGNLPLTVTIAATGPYAQTNTCNGSVAAGANCTISVTFTPVALGAQTGSITLTDNAANSPQTMSLSGTGQQAVAGLSPASLTFGNQNVGTTSAVQTVTLTNSGNLPLTVTGIVASAQYAETNTCGASVAAGANCTISVTFTPTTSGSQAGSVTITDNAANSPQTISLSGTGQQAVAGLSPASLTFGNQNVGTTSAVQTVTVTNTGNIPLTISSIQASASYAENDTCIAASPITVNGTCTINVTFTPTAQGNQPGSITLTDNAPNSPQTITLSGTGLQAAVSLAPASLTFGNQNVGTTSTVQTVTLTNSGNLPLTVTIAATGPYAQTNTCNGGVAAEANCTISVTFTPTALGAQPGSVTLTDNAANSPQAMSLSGTGTQAGLSLSQTNLAFGNQEVSQPSVAQTVTLTNTGSSNLTVSFTPSGPYTPTNTCTGGIVPANGTCILSVIFTPTAAISQPGSIAVTYNASGSPQNVSLSGSGIQALAALSPSTSSSSPLVFGTTVGTPSAAQTVTVTNNGNEALNFTNIQVSGPFAQTNCNSSVAASGGTCTFSVTYQPTTPGVQTGSITLTDNAAGGSQTIYLSGSAPPPPTTITAPTSTLDNFDGNFTVSWQRITSASEYQLYASQDGGTYSLESVITPNSTISNQPPSITSGTWTFEVRPCGTGGCSAMSAPSASVIVAEPPTDLAFSPTGTSTSGSFTLNWDGDAFQYRVYQSSDGGVDWTWVATTNRATTSYTPPDLANGTYVYEITSCISGAGCSADSSTASKTVSLSKPSGLSLSPSGTSSSGTFTLSWSGPSWTYQYRVYQSSNGGTSYQWVDTTNASASGSTSYTTDALANGTYIYYVEACNKNACSNSSATVSKTVSHPGGGGGGGGGCPPPPESCQLVMPDDGLSPRNGIWGARMPRPGSSLPESIVLGSRNSSRKGDDRHPRPAKGLVVGLLEDLRERHALVSDQKADI